MNVEHYAMVARHIAARQLSAARVLRFHLAMKGQPSEFVRQPSEFILRNISEAVQAEYRLAYSSLFLDSLLAATERLDKFRHEK